MYGRVGARGIRPFSAVGYGRSAANNIATTTQYYVQYHNIVITIRDTSNHTLKFEYLHVPPPPTTMDVSSVLNR